MTRIQKIEVADREVPVFKEQQPDLFFVPTGDAEIIPFRMTSLLPNGGKNEATSPSLHNGGLSLGEHSLIEDSFDPRINSEMLGSNNTARAVDHFNRTVAGILLPNKTVAPIPDWKDSYAARHINNILAVHDFTPGVVGKTLRVHDTTGLPVVDVTEVKVPLTLVLDTRYRNEVLPDLGGLAQTSEHYIDPLIIAHSPEFQELMDKTGTPLLRKADQRVEEGHMALVCAERQRLSMGLNRQIQDVPELLEQARAKLMRTEAWRGAQGSHALNQQLIVEIWRRLHLAETLKFDTAGWATLTAAMYNTHRDLSSIRISPDGLTVDRFAPETFSGIRIR